ncbi:MAG: acetoacetate decarboxylase family protein [Acidimicrobiales bacterium]
MSDGDRAEEPTTWYGSRDSPWERPFDGGEPIWTDSLEVTYLTDASAAAAVLPPPLEPSDASLVRMSIASWTDIDDSPAGEARVSVQATLDGLLGEYPLLVCHTSEAAVIEDREILGSPAKLAEVTSVINGKRIDNRFERDGRLVGRIVGTVNRPDRTDTRRRTEFMFRTIRSVEDSARLDRDPELLKVSCVVEERRAATIGGIVRLGRSEFDPIADLPMRHIRGTRLVQQFARRRVESSQQVSASAFEPFLHQRYDSRSV